MDAIPRCVIVTGRQGSGKTTLAKKLGRELWMPVICRDEIKEGFVSTFGIRHDELPADTNLRVTELFFEIVRHYLAGNVSVVIEAAFQHQVWEPRIAELIKFSSPLIILCTVDETISTQRALQRGFENPRRDFYHGDMRFVHYRDTGEILPPAAYDPPAFDLPTIVVTTDGEYVPSLREIGERIGASTGKRST